MDRVIGKDVVTLRQEARAAETLRRLRAFVDAYREADQAWNSGGDPRGWERAKAALVAFDAWDGNGKR